MPVRGTILGTVGLIHLTHGIQRAFIGLNLMPNGFHFGLKPNLILLGNGDEFTDQLHVCFRIIISIIVVEEILDSVFLVKQLIESSPFARGYGGGFLFRYPLPLLE